jgi:hypothetical protein
LYLGCIQQAVRARFVDEASRPAGVVEDRVKGRIGKHRRVHACIVWVSVDISRYLRAIQVPQFALEINPLADGRICLQTQSVPEFRLPDEYQSQGTLGVQSPYSGKWDKKREL